MDEMGEFIIGVNILVKGIMNGIIIDLDGYFLLDVDCIFVILIIFYIGYGK